MGTGAAAAYGGVPAGGPPQMAAGAATAPVMYQPYGYVNLLLWSFINLPMVTHSQSKGNWSMVLIR